MRLKLTGRGSYTHTLAAIIVMLALGVPTQSDAQELSDVTIRTMLEQLLDDTKSRYSPSPDVFIDPSEPFQPSSNRVGERARRTSLMGILSSAGMPMLPPGRRVCPSGVRSDRMCETPNGSWVLRFRSPSASGDKATVLFELIRPEPELGGISRTGYIGAFERDSNGVWRLESVRIHIIT